MKLDRGQILSKISGDKYFSSKLLLFGEYAIIKGGHGLAIPYSEFRGQLVLGEKETHKKFFELYDYINKSPLLAKKLDLKRFKADLDKGLYFDSNIPQGYGIGSSGALCAAIYQEYCTEKRITKLKELQDYMALMESFYHGTSSGLDCLISLVDQAVYIKDRKDVSTINCPLLNDLGYFYLLDSKIERRTSPFVYKFLDRFENDQTYREKFEKFIEMSNDTINSFLKAKRENFLFSIEKLSIMQREIMQDMIPENIREFWDQGLESKKYFTKLCGAGGGGFFLVYSSERLELAELKQIKDGKL